MLTAELPAASPAGPSSGTATRGWAFPLAIVVIGMFISLLDVTIVNVAVPAIQRDFGGSLDDVTWIATAYTLTLGVVVPLTSWLGDRYGLTRLYLVALVGFAVGSGLCGLAWDLNSLIFFRILQAVPGGILPVASLTMVYRLSPPDKVSVGLGVWGLGGICAPAVGPVLGGYLVEYVDWRLVFYLNVPVGLITAAGLALFVPKLRGVPVPPLDWYGFTAITVSVSAILLAASEGESWGWTGYRILMLLVTGVLFLAAFVVIELEVEHPLLDIRLFANHRFAVGFALTTLFFVNLLISSFYVPVFLQQAQGLQAFDSGLVVLPQALVMCFLIPVSGLLYDTLGPRLMSAVGLVLLGVGNVLMCRLTPDTPDSLVVLWTSVRALGISAGAVAALNSFMSAAPPRSTNQASAINNVGQQVGAALALAALGSLLSGQQAQLYADRTALLTDTSALGRLAGPLLHSSLPFTQESFAPAYRLAMRLQVEVLSLGLGNIFLLVGLITLAAAPLSLLIKHTVRETVVVEDPEPVAVPVEPSRAAPRGRVPAGVGAGRGAGPDRPVDEPRIPEPKAPRGAPVPA